MMLRMYVRLRSLGDQERGDVPGWVLITLMTAMLVAALWAVARTKIIEIFEKALTLVS